MELLNYIKKNKTGLIIVIILLVPIFKNSYLPIYPVSIFFVLLIFILVQYFNLNTRCFIIFSFILMSVCPFLIFFNFENIAEYFTNLMYIFFVLSVVGYFFDNLREKLKSKGTNKIYKKVFLSILVIFLLSSAFIFVRDYRRNSDYTLLVKENFVKFAASAKNKYIKTFKKDVYYSGLDVVEADSKKISRDIIINIDNPKAGSDISTTIDLSGWAIETNSPDNAGIDKIEFFLDGKPGKGKYLGSFSIPYYRSNIETVKVLENLYLQFYNRKPSENELNLWTINLEYRLLPFYDVVLSITNSSGMVNKNLTNEDFVKVLYLGLFNRGADEGGLKYWSDLLNGGGTDRYGVLNVFLNSEEFKIKSDNYYNAVPLRKETLNIMRKDVGEKYGKQFYLSGFNFQFDSTGYKNGNHTIYIFAHSPIFGWDYKTLIINIEN